ncbi:MAG: bifunctional DedA family/phosphatase PAP2 family protein [Thermoleophilaceae bacterium]|nr:bifunctional DedA family/phosphatase PAP2 family protein [Thermoleophilaceae bacterium]
MSLGQVIALVAAAAIAGGAIDRRVKGKVGNERLLLALVVTAALLTYVTGLLDKLPDPEKVIEDVAVALGPWTYVLVGGLAFLETGAFVGLVAPGEFAVIVGGVVAAQGEIDIVPLIGLVWFCAIAGDSVSFYIGQRLGRGFLEKHGGKVQITPERLEKVEDYFERYGGRTILIGRFIGLVRALAPFIAGSSGMTYRGFIPYSIVGTGLWASTFCMLGYIFYRSFEQVAGIAGKATVAFGFVVAVVFGTVWAYRKLRQPGERRKLEAWLDRQGRRPLLRPVAFVVRPLWRRVLLPLGRLLAPPVRFLIHRVTPGELGLEFTTAIAIGAVGFYVFALYALILARDPGLTPADGTFQSTALELRQSFLTDVAEVVSALGSLPVTGLAVLVTAGWLWWKRGRGEAIMLVTAFILIYIAVHVAKAEIGRPRPAGALVGTEGSAFPSGHAAYATLYVWIALLAGRVLGVVSQVGIVVVALVLGAAIGFTRVYLGAHYWSDVAGGWGLGFGLLGLCSAVALLVFHVGQNESDGVPVRG